jgi:hypothetical protein
MAQTKGRLGWREIANRDAGRLRFPGSILVWEHGFDEGQPHGFDNLDRVTTEFTRWWRTTGAYREVIEWFAEQLVRLGWKVNPPPMSTEGNTFTRFSNAEWETFFLVIKRRGYGLWWPPGLDEGTDTVYDTTYQVKPIRTGKTSSA